MGVVSLTALPPTLDATWAADEIEHFFKLHDRWLDERMSNRPYTSGLEDALWGVGEVILLVLTRTTPEWSPPPVDEDRDPWERWDSIRTAARRALPRLRRAEELARKLGDGAPALSAAKLHPWAWEGARSLWQSGHHAEAVGAASRKVNAETQNKVARRDVSEENLFKESFSTHRPEAGKPRLRLMTDDGSKTFASVHRGAMALAEGLFAAVRNRIAHQDGLEVPEQEALELLAAWSVLARWVEQAEVVAT